MERLLASSGLRWVCAALLAAALAAWLAGATAGNRALAQLERSTAADVRLRAALFDSEIARFRLLPLALADDRDVVAAIGGAPLARQALNRKLEALARDTGAAAFYVIDPNGRAIAASNWRSPQSFVGTDYSFRRYYRDARASGAGDQFALGTVSRRPGLYIARRTPADGVIVIKLEFNRIEREWARAGGITIVREAQGIILVTSRPDWRFATTMPLAKPAIDRFRSDASLSSNRMLALSPTFGSIDGAAHAVAVMPTRQPGWALTVLRPTASAVAGARRAAAIGAALLVIALASLAWGLRQRALLQRKRRTELEEAVVERTAELRQEIEERAASEARAAELREGLRQANRLATLGQVTAGVAHETAQPVAAIRTYAQSSALLLERGAIAEVRQNLTAIARLADRIGSVTSELRGFSRRATGEIRPVALTDVVDGACLILKDQLRTVALDVPVIAPGLRVFGGRVRLEQVLVNLIQNAVEALADIPVGRITLNLTTDDEYVRLTVADNGPGIPAEQLDRLFMPFATTKRDGLGLGLVIAQEIMADLGGSLRLLKSEQGTTFEMAMRAA